jgi:hypothetical protein
VAFAWLPAKSYDNQPEEFAKDSRHTDGELDPREPTPLTAYKTLPWGVLCRDAHSTGEFWGSRNMSWALTTSR